MAAKGPSKAQQGWALFDRIIAVATKDGYTNPWRIHDKNLTYEPDYETLTTLLGVPLFLEADTQTRVPALALDVWIAYELRRAGFTADAVWPRAQHPRVMPAPLAALIQATPARGGERAALENRIRKSGSKSELIASETRILGKNYDKQVDVVLSGWNTGPEILISTKRMDSSFSKNAANRVEESYGDAKNLRLRHPQAALGFVFGLRSTIYEKEGTKAEWLIDLLGKLGQEDDAYHAVALLLLDYDKEPPAEKQPVNEPASGPDDGQAPEETAPPVVDSAQLDADIAALPAVRILLDDRTPDNLHPARFLANMVLRVLKSTPVDYHRHARDQLKNPLPLIPH